MSEVRLQRFMSQAGVASRRKSEELIARGEVRVNGRVVTELGTKVDPARDRVTVGGRALEAELHVYVLLNKPKGYVTTRHDPERRPTVMQLVRGVAASVYPVGRLDFNTEGVLLLTNDGELAHALMHPSRGVEKIYQVKIRGAVDESTADRLAAGVTLDDGTRTAAARVQLLGPSEGGRNTWIEVAIHEGKNRQIHRMVEALGYQVAKLRRVRYAELDADELRLGSWRELTDREVRGLYRAAGLKQEQPERHPRKRRS